MRVRVDCELAYRVHAETLFVFNIEVQRTARQTVKRERLTLEPHLDVERWIMPGSGNRYLRVNVPSGSLRLHYEAEIHLTPDLQDPASVAEVPLARLPLSVFPDLYPNRGKLDHFARTTFSDIDSGYARVLAICNWICDSVGSGGSLLDELAAAFDSATRQSDMCRDFAHLGIALCRTLGIPARYVAAYAVQPAGLYAAFEAYLCGPDGPGWYIFDPTRRTDPASLIRVGLGRDATEVVFCNTYGAVADSASVFWFDKLGPAAATALCAVRTM